MYSYYTDSSFKPPKQKQDGTWKRERARYRIYNLGKTIKVSERLLGLQNILQAELLAIHHALQIIVNKFPNKPTYIFTNSLTSLYLLIKQFKHPTYYIDHPDQTIFHSMIEMLIQWIQTTIITKIKAHANIVKNESLNESADALAKLGNKLPHRSPLYPYEKAHSTPYYFHKDHWPSMDETPNKGPISYLQLYLLKYDMQHSLEYIAWNFFNIHKWTSDTNIDNETSTSIWNHLNITYCQKPVFSNSDTTNIWAIHTNNYSLVLNYILILRIHYVNLQN